MCKKFDFCNNWHFLREDAGTELTLSDGEGRIESFLGK